MPTYSSSLDVLDLLSTWTGHLRSSLRAADDGSDYARGQLAVLDRLEDAIEAAGPRERASEVLARVVEDVGLAMEGTHPTHDPLSQREAGILAAWTLCLGFVEGLAAGAEATVEALREASGGQGWFDTR